MSDDDAFATWLTKPQAAEVLGCSTKTIEKLAADGRIQQAARRPHGRGPERAVYNPDDVRRVAQERRPGLPPFVLPAGLVTDVHATGNGHGPAAELLPDVRPALASGLSALLAALQPLLAPTSENSQKTFLTLLEASAASGLTVTYLRRRIRAGTLAAEKDRGWKIRRRDLEAL